MSEGKVGCSEKVHDAFGVGFHPCSRVGRVERDGKWYCSQHDPCYVKKRREQRQVENQQQLKHQRIYSQVDMDAALRRAKGEGMEELEQKYRKELWLNHGHHGLYGDDGEMQCIECHPYGATDYKRDPLDKVEHATFRARMARAAQIENEATK